MQQLLVAKDSIDTASHLSAFKPVSTVSKSPLRSCKQRDSGYGSDFSPAGLKSHSGTFTSDDDDDSELNDAFEQLDISADEDVFVDRFECHFHVIKECGENDDTDKEVEELLGGNYHRNTKSQNVQIIRPGAPLPALASGHSSDNGDLTDSVSSPRDLCLIASPYYHTNWTTRDRYMCRNPFHPPGSRSVGTQTPNSHCQLVQDVVCSRRVAFDRGRLRLQSEGEQLLQPLPDVVPMSRDRSVSLPDVPSLQRLEHQQHVGRELRRISDEFHSVYLRRQRRRPRTRSEDPSLSSRFSVDLPSYWNSLRRLVSRSPIFQTWSRENY